MPGLAVASVQRELFAGRRERAADKGDEVRLPTKLQKLDDGKRITGSRERVLDLARVDAQPAKLDERVILPAQILDQPIAGPARAVARAVHRQPRGEGIWDEGGGGEVGPIEVPATDLVPRKAEFPDRANWEEARGVCGGDDVCARVAVRATYDACGDIGRGGERHAYTADGDLCRTVATMS